MHIYTWDYWESDCRLLYSKRGEGGDKKHEVYIYVPVSFLFFFHVMWEKSKNEKIAVKILKAFENFLFPKAIANIGTRSSPCIVFKIHFYVLSYAARFTVKFVEGILRYKLLKAKVMLCCFDKIIIIVKRKVSLAFCFEIVCFVNFIMCIVLENIFLILYLAIPIWIQTRKYAFT